MLKILLVEDEVKLADSVKSGMESLDIRCEVCHDGVEAWDLLQKNSFDVLVSDVMLPQMSGIELVQKIRKSGMQIPILLLTALGHMEDKTLGFEAGADDYLVKPFELKELELRIKAISRRSNELSLTESKYYKSFDLKINHRSKTVIRNKSAIKSYLTPKEYALLMYFLKNPGKLVTKEELFENVWGLDFDTGTNIVEVYINFLRKKLDRDHEIRLIHTVPRSGYIFEART